ncbi:MAG: response regulator [Nisaea sp.]|uniref:response regulator n=1 Tax=Nisaea sp. TaxID=2024842 RepID=UPI001B1C1DD7|nr:response regulator [Nisaea sp.]MBO6560917.1 response regulator [Nisaea sp.]
MTKPLILIVDDEPEIAQLVSEVAYEIGIASETAGSAKAFMRHYETLHPSGIVMDLVMPDMDGIELVQWLAERDCDVPILLMSGFNPSYADALVEIAKANNIRISDRLTKPVGIEKLEAALLALVSASAEAVSTSSGTVR